MSPVNGDAKERDYRWRFEKYKMLEAERDGLIDELIGRLESLQTERDVIKADLEVEQDVRRRLQSEVSKLQKLEKTMTQGRFVLVVIDADADIYMFHEKYLRRGERGGKDAAADLMLKVREYLTDFMEDAETVAVVVKAYANLSGLAQACLKHGKLATAMNLNSFVIGFNRGKPLFDFVDIGAGKEEADNKIRNVLHAYVPNPHCQHIIVGCCHDQGYFPSLRDFDTGPPISDKITLLQGGSLSSKMESLGFKKTDQLDSLFCSESPILTPVSPSSSKASSVVNSERLGPVKTNHLGHRVDKDLNVDPKILQAMKKLNLCSWHYLREDCTTSCKRNHLYPRPLVQQEYDALWYLARAGACYKGPGCLDEKCIYGHRSG